MAVRYPKLIGISCCQKAFGVFGMVNHAASDTYVRAVDQVVGAVPILIPANGKCADVSTLLDRLDGLILTGSRSNVAAEFYGGPPQISDDAPEDPARDQVTLPLVRGAIERGLPVLAICRGLQELNVALGGTLHQRLQEMPGKIDHSTPMQAHGPVRVGKAHFIAIRPGGVLDTIVQSTRLAVNSLHNQGIQRMARGLLVEARAIDGTIEAISGTGRGYLLGVQWHPEYDFDRDIASQRVFESFGAAVRGV
ncbi:MULTISPECIES: gamma-glutamyl-gamma-aminobutyrate hydrolase family protein [Acidiphilium]|uniref:gamma-glutamyl-gamma-aminobutyrate hydrolase n=1 Tax=Acidiphilium rubrum TaxID=526 RepID=A0A8G2FLI4_ACIRU|nr:MULTISPECIES: gamma-glutamyl-gamma-aminobutyrate hydrolase family protein [Acidiphilium]SIR04712.1 putative glutamine amidotransferase [Acidiphilium rubrum]